MNKKKPPLFTRLTVYHHRRVERFVTRINDTRRVEALQRGHRGRRHRCTPDVSTQVQLPRRLVRVGIDPNEEMRKSEEERAETE